MVVSGEIHTPMCCHACTPFTFAHPSHSLHPQDKLICPTLNTLFFTGQYTHACLQSTILVFTLIKINNFFLFGLRVYFSSVWVNFHAHLLISTSERCRPLITGDFSLTETRIGKFSIESLLVILF